MPAGGGPPLVRGTKMRVAPGKLAAGVGSRDSAFAFASVMTTEQGPLVGRERELGEATGALEGAASGRGRLLMLVGEPGIGKTSLADSIATMAASRGFKVLWGRCWESGGRTKELIGLGVAAQIPCHYCIYAHTSFARLNGASDTEIGEAVAMAAITRHWSTYLNGTQTDEGKFRGEIAKIVENVKRASAAKGAPAAPVTVVDGASALKEAAQMLGYVPDFLRTFPDEARAGAWKQMRDVQLNPGTALAGKNKELVGLAVASQIPCKFCIIAHTEFAKLNGATDAEIHEAIAMAALTRDLSTMLNGMEVDEPQFRRDIDHLVKGAKAAAQKAAAKIPATAQR